MKYRNGIIHVMGTPLTGKTTVVNALIEASKELIAVIRVGDIARRLSTPEDIEHMKKGYLFPREQELRAEILAAIEKAYNHSMELIIIEGFPRSLDQLNWALDNHIVGTDLHGCIIQISATDVEGRAANRMRDEQDLKTFIEKKINFQRAEIYKMETRIHQVGIPYFTVMNDNLEHAVKDLAKKLGLRK